MAQGIQLTGEWGKAGLLLKTGAVKLNRAQDMAAHQEVQLLRKMIVQGMTQQAPAGKTFQPLSPMTLALRKLRRFRGTKVLIRSASLRNSVKVHGTPNPKGSPAYFVGVHRTARSRDGKELVHVAEIQEFGTGPIVVPVTPKVRRLFLALYIRGLIKAPLSPGTRAIVYPGVPARPYMRPAFKRWKQGLHKRFALRTAMILKGEMGRP